MSPHVALLSHQCITHPSTPHLPPSCSLQALRTYQKLVDVCKAVYGERHQDTVGGVRSVGDCLKVMLWRACTLGGTASG